MITLAHDLESIHHDLGHRLVLAADARPDVRHPRDHYTAIDTFLAAAQAEVGDSEAEERAATLLTRLNIPERLWSLAPATFSGGEQQRVNIARGFDVDYPILLLDEPTASLDAANRQVVIDLILEAKAKGVAIVGIFHDAEVREAVADRLFEVMDFQRSAA